MQYIFIDLSLSVYESGFHEKKKIQSTFVSHIFSTLGTWLIFNKYLGDWMNK